MEVKTSKEQAMNIIEQLSRHTEAWKKFLKWSNSNTYDDWEMWSHETKGFTVARERYLLSDVQAFLDSEGIYADSFINFKTKEFTPCWSRGTLNTHQSEVFGKDTRPEALLAAIDKGMEMLNKQIK